MRPLRALLALGLLAALVAPTAASSAPAQGSDPASAAAEGNPWLERRVLNSAHRGGAFEWPENTLYAFREGLLRGVDQLETDVVLTSDGEVLVLHDETVDRTTDGAGRAAELTLAQVKALDAAHWHVDGRYATRDAAPQDYRFRGVRTGDVPPPEGYTADWFAVPTLREVLETFPGVLLNIEIKPDSPEITVRTAQTVAALLAEFGRTDDVLVVASEDAMGTVFKATAPQVHTAPGIAQAAAFVLPSQGPLVGLPAGYDQVHRALQLPVTFGPLEVVTADLVADAHAAGLAVHVFTIDDREEMARLVDLGVDSIMTNRTQVLEQVLREKGVAGELTVPVRPCPAPVAGSCPGDPR